MRPMWGLFLILEVIQGPIDPAGVAASWLCPSPPNVRHKVARRFLVATPHPVLPSTCAGDHLGWRRVHAGVRFSLRLRPETAKASPHRFPACPTFHGRQLVLLLFSFPCGVTRLAHCRCSITCCSRVPHCDIDEQIRNFWYSTGPYIEQRILLSAQLRHQNFTTGRSAHFITYVCPYLREGIVSPVPQGA